MGTAEAAGGAASHLTGVVLAAGSGTRMGRPKGEIVVAGERLVDRAARVLRDGGCDPVVAIVRDGVRVVDAVVIVNPDPGRGMRSSLALAVDAAPAGAALLVLLADLPGVGAQAVRDVAAAWRPGRIAIANYEGRRGHPIVMDVDLWSEAVAAAGADEGARALLGRRADLVDDVPTTGDPSDLDTPDDLERFLRP